MAADDANKTKKKTDEAQFIDFSLLSQDEIIRLSNGTKEDRAKSCVPLSKVTPEEVQRVTPMSFWEEAACILFLAFAIPNGAITIPLVTFLIGRFIVGNVLQAFLVLGMILLPLAIIPQPCRPESLHCWMSVQVIRYFSFKLIFEEPTTTQLKGDDDLTNKKQRPQICVAPPHGVFPYGNVLAILTWPIFVGHHFRGLAASAAVNMPVFKQIMRSIGVVDASRATARKCLEQWPYTIGISTGGVAEIYETNTDHECVLLKERIGMIKLAIRTGADLVPCYLFGNTKLLDCWLGEGIPGAKKALERLARRIGFGLILIFGRFGLPIPYRLPVVGVVGKAIPTHAIQNEEPTMEQVEQIQSQLFAQMQELFEKYKGKYGWEDKDLIIK